MSTAGQFFVCSQTASELLSPLTFTLYTTLQHLSFYTHTTLESADTFPDKSINATENVL